MTDYQAVKSSIYWASVPLTTLDDCNFGGWTIYRDTPPSIPDQKSLEPIQMVDTSLINNSAEASFRNRDQFITDMIESHGNSLPILLYDIKGFYKFHLVGPKTLYEGYGGLYNPPEGTFRDKSVILINSWKYPFCMVADVILYPLDKWLEHALRNWT